MSNRKGRGGRDENESLEDALTPFDEYIKNAAQQHDHYCIPDPDSIKEAAREFDKHEKISQPDSRRIRKDAAATDEHYKIPSPKEIRKIAQTSPEHTSYIRFRETLEQEINTAYAKVFPQNHPEQENIKKLLKKTILYHDGREHLLSETRPLHIIVGEYAARETLSQETGSLKLTPAESDAYKTGYAALHIKQALDDPEHKDKLLQKATTALREANKKNLAETVPRIYHAVQEFYGD